MIRKVSNSLDGVLEIDLGNGLFGKFWDMFADTVLEHYGIGKYDYAYELLFDFADGKINADDFLKEVKDARLEIKKKKK